MYLNSYNGMGRAWTKHRRSAKIWSENLKEGVTGEIYE
jgi:hypothetical protein